jgi:K+-transporting ATPase c subunit
MNLSSNGSVKLLSAAGTPGRMKVNKKYQEGAQSKRAAVKKKVKKEVQNVVTRYKNAKNKAAVLIDLKTQSSTSLVDDDVNANAAADSYADIVDTTVTTKLKKLAPELLLKRTTSPRRKAKGNVLEDDIKPLIGK